LFRIEKKQNSQSSVVLTFLKIFLNKTNPIYFLNAFKTFERQLKFRNFTISKKN